MFEIGRRYTFILGVDEGRYETVGTVEAYEFPLLKLADINYKGNEFLEARLIRGDIINVTSAYFNKATLKDD